MVQDEPRDVRDWERRCPSGPGFRPGEGMCRMIAEGKNFLYGRGRGYGVEIAGKDGREFLGTNVTEEFGEVEATLLKAEGGHGIEKVNVVYGDILVVKADNNALVDNHAGVFGKWNDLLLFEGVFGKDGCAPRATTWIEKLMRVCCAKGSGEPFIPLGAEFLKNDNVWIDTFYGFGDRRDFIVVGENIDREDFERRFGELGRRLGRILVNENGNTGKRDEHRGPCEPPPFSENKETKKRYGDADGKMSFE